MPNVEYEIAPDVQEEMRAFPGKWAALTRDHLIAIGDSAAEAKDRAAAKEPGFVPILTHIRDADGNTLFV
ncbi:MAG: DUF5678 domain-containing protein [Actinomycetota bacterium]|nr:DUF5678 domain-containing protein [Actinomycetota bacterium]